METEKILNKVNTKRKYYTLETLKQINRSYDREHVVTQYDVNKVNRLIDVIEKNSSVFLAVGDIIQCHGYNDYHKKDMIYDNGHLEDLNYLDTGKLSICTEPYTPFTWERSEKPTFSTSGGYWFAENDKTKFELIGHRLKTFCAWGHNGATANGAVNFQARVNVWKYVNKDKIY